MSSLRGIGIALASAILLLAIAGQARADEKVTVRVGVLRSSLVSVIHAVALKRGYYEREGLDVKVTDFRSGDGTAGVESVLRGDLDIYIGTPVELARVDSAAVAKGSPAPLVGVAAGSPGLTNLVLRKDIPFKSIEDIKGLRIGVSSLGSDHLVIFRHYLATKNLTTDALELKLVRVGGTDMPAALLTKQIDGFLHSEPTTSLALAKSNGKRALGRSDFGVASESPNLAVSVRRDWASHHQEEVRRCVEALQKASADYPTIPKAEMVKIFTDYIGGEEDILALAYGNIDPRLHDIKKMASAFWDINIAAMKQRGEISDALKPADLFDASYSGK